VEAEGERGAASVLAKPGDEVVLKLARGTLTGVAADEQGHAVTDFSVRLLPRAGGPSRNFPTLSPTGDFRLDVPPGSYSVTARASGYLESAPLAADVHAMEKGETFVKLTLTRSSSVRGKIR